MAWDTVAPWARALSLLVAAAVLLSVRTEAVVASHASAAAEPVAVLPAAAPVTAAAPAAMVVKASPAAAIQAAPAAAIQAAPAAPATAAPFDAEGPLPSGAEWAAAQEPVMAASLLSQGLAEDIAGRRNYRNQWSTRPVPSRSYREMMMEDGMAPRRGAAGFAPAALASDNGGAYDVDALEKDGINALKRRQQRLEGSVKLAADAWRTAQEALVRFSAREHAVEREELLERRSRLRLERLMEGAIEHSGGAAAPEAPAPLVRRAPRRSAYARQPPPASQVLADDTAADGLDEDPDTAENDAPRVEPRVESMDDWPRARQQTRYRHRAALVESAEPASLGAIAAARGAAALAAEPQVGEDADTDESGAADEPES